MIKLLLISVMAFSVSCQTHINAVNSNLSRDSIMKKYFLLVDSLPYFDTLDLKFKLLKAYNENDTGYLKRSYGDLVELSKFKKEMSESNICEEPAPLNTPGYEESYRFIYGVAFCDKWVNITIGKNIDSATVELYLYEYIDKETRCKTIKHIKKRINDRDWKNFITDISYADFWGLKEDNGIHGFDGSSLDVTGFEKPRKAFKGNYKRIYRWAAEETAIGTSFKHLLNLSGVSVDCFRFQLSDHN